jgi:hypothetical protein
MIFLQFSTDFKSFSKTHTLLKKLFYTEVPGGFDSFTNKALVHRKVLKCIEINAIGS